MQEIVDGWHPAIAVTEQAQIWTLKWNRSFTPHFQLLAYLLSEVPRSPEQQIDFVISAGDLRDSMRAMSSKVGCADCWHHKDLIFSELLGCGILSLTPAKSLPTSWKRARVALLWKNRKRTRPITLPSGLWRAAPNACRLSFIRGCSLGNGTRMWEAHVAL